MFVVIYAVAAAAVFWLGMMLTASGIGGLPFVVLVVIFVALRFLGVIAWHWLWVILLLWGGIGGVIAKTWIVTRDPLWRFRR